MKEVKICVVIEVDEVYSINDVTAEVLRRLQGDPVVCIAVSEV